MGNYEQAVKYIEKALKDYPESGIRVFPSASMLFWEMILKQKRHLKTFT